MGGGNRMTKLFYLEDRDWNIFLKILKAKGYDLPVSGNELTYIVRSTLWQKGDDV
jgi:hypothetical protein